jgi:hypothetical protein
MKIPFRCYFLDLRFERAEILRFLLEQQIRCADRAKCVRMILGLLPPASSTHLRSFMSLPSTSSVFPGNV